MNIAQIRQCDIGLSGIVCTGKVGYVGDSQNITGTKDGRAYDFWSQFLTLQDETDSIGVSISADSQQSLLTRDDKGVTITVEKCALKSYIKDDKEQLKLQGFIRRQAPPKPQQASSQATGQPKPAGSIAESEIRLILVGAAIQSGQFEVKSNIDIEYWKNYIITGRAPLPPSKIPNPHPDIQEPSVIPAAGSAAEDDIPF